MLQRDLFTHRKKRKIPFKKNPKDKKTKTAATLKTCFVSHFIQIPSFWALCFISLRAGPGGLELSRMACRRGWGSRLFGSFYSFGSPLLQVCFFFFFFLIVSETQVRTPWEPTVLGLERQATGPAPLYVPVFHSSLLGKEKKQFWEGLPLATSVSSG